MDSLISSVVNEKNLTTFYYKIDKRNFSKTFFLFTYLLHYTRLHRRAHNFAQLLTYRPMQIHTHTYRPMQTHTYRPMQTDTHTNYAGVIFWFGSDFLQISLDNNIWGVAKSSQIIRAFFCNIENNQIQLCIL